MACEILIKASAEKEIRRLPRNVREWVNSVILALREEPRPLSVRKLRGEEGWRIRVSDYRVVYRIEDGLRKVTVYRVRHRRDIYRF
ncbi:MAG: type II toxin-antitoxin system RelE/ParE family toxin [Chloroflexota bacterium]|nr:type II toxin-antitoxin system RelE/ParE family toxin [Chloroflexota bacterium]